MKPLLKYSSGKEYIEKYKNMTTQDLECLLTKLFSLEKDYAVNIKNRFKSSAKTFDNN